MKSKWWLLFIIAIAAILRLYQLNSNPPSLNWDETAIGWNAHTIFHTRRDEFGTRLPLSFKSFGDYKSPVYIYLTAPIVGLLGLNPVSVRLVSVLAGIAGVYLIYLLGLELKNKQLGLIAAALLAITPWHVILSRPAFEPNLALFFVLLGTYLFLKAFKKPKILVLSAISFVLAMYTYHSPKIFVPVFLLGLSFIYRRTLLSKKLTKWVLVSCVLGLIILTPLIKETFFAKSAIRFQGTSVFYDKEENKLPLSLPLITQIFKNYFIHFSPSYLFLGSNNMPRLQLKIVGPLLLIEAPFLLFGLLYLLKNRRKQWVQCLLWWLIAGPIPAAIGREVPHPLRAYNLLPPLILITALGIHFLLRSWSKVSRVIIIIFAINAAFFIHHYFFVYPIYSAPDWQYGYQEAAIFAGQNEDQADKIIFTSHYGQSYIFTYFYQNRDPLSVFWGAMRKYLFRNINWPEDQKKTNTLIIGSPEEIPADAQGIIKEILFPDGQVAFRIVKTL
ncbi:MAG: glycosyltransferase family 39 protein [Patescibacteria group bacterium]|nr:glycosyltransferase family 39 protein [Patescibacteria group bacterium]